MTPIKKIHQLLTKNKLSLTAAESFTGGAVSAKITAIAGASNFFKEGIVCYSESSKQKRLGVEQQILKEFGAVSLPCARQMLFGALKNFDAAVITTGNAGPSVQGDGSVGVCYIGAGIKGKLIIQRHYFTGDRKEVIKKGTDAAIKLLYKILSENFK